MLLDVLEVVAPVKHIGKLRDFIEMKLPPGFPVKVDIPILPTITARVIKDANIFVFYFLFFKYSFQVSFQDFEFRDNIPDSLFQVPKDYSENPAR